MSTLVVAACYGSAIALALALLWYFGARSWYWHVLSVCGAMSLGLAPLPSPWNSPEGTLAVGWIFLMLFVWGAVAPLFALSHHPPHFRPH